MSGHQSHEQTQICFRMLSRAQATRRRQYSYQGSAQAVDCLLRARTIPLVAMATQHGRQPRPIGTLRLLLPSDCTVGRSPRRQTLLQGLAPLDQRLIDQVEDIGR